MATCPKCRKRFRFRALEKSNDPVLESRREQERSNHGFRDVSREENSPRRQPILSEQPAPQAEHTGAAPSAARPYAVPKIQRPQSAFREAAEQADADIWEAMDALHQRWQNQMDQQVTEVVTPRPSAKMSPPRPAAPSRAENTPPREAPQEEQVERPAQAPQSPDTSQDFHDSQDAEAADTQPRTQAVSTSFPSMSELYESMADEEWRSPTMASIGLGSSTPSANTRTLVNYSERGSTPEDIVEEDIKILQHSPTAKRPLRDLGKLKEFLEPKISPPDEFAEGPVSAENEEDAAEYYPGPFTEHEHGETNVPWENPENYGGWPKALVSTIYMVMLRAPSFFSSLGKPSTSLSHCYLFFLILGYIAIIGSVFWGELTQLLIQDAPPRLDNLLTLPVLLVVAPLALGLMQLFVTGCIRLQLRVLAPDRADFATSYRITAYAVAPFVVCLIPFVGPYIAAGWFAYTLATGCRYALGLSWWASLAVTLPPAGLLIGGICWFFLSTPGI